MLHSVFMALLKPFGKQPNALADTWVEVMRLHLEQDNLNDERQACTAILSNLEGTAHRLLLPQMKESSEMTSGTGSVKKMEPGSCLDS